MRNRPYRTSSPAFAIVPSPWVKARTGHRRSPITLSACWERRGHKPRLIRRRPPGLTNNSCNSGRMPTRTSSPPRKPAGNKRPCQLWARTKQDAALILFELVWPRATRPRSSSSTSKAVGLRIGVNVKSRGRVARDHTVQTGHPVHTVRDTGGSEGSAGVPPAVPRASCPRKAEHQGKAKSLVPAESFEALAPLLAVAMQGIVDDGIGLSRRLDLIHFHRFAFQLLVILKKAPQHERAVGRHLRRLLVSVELRVLRGHRDDLVVFLSG